MYKIRQKQHLAAARWMDEWTRAGAGAGGAVVMSSNPQSMNFFFFFFSTLKKFLSFLAG